MKATSRHAKKAPDTPGARSDAATGDPAGAAVRPRLALSVQDAAGEKAIPSRYQLRRWLGACEPGSARITVRFVGADESRTLNATYRGKDHATNVLSFPYAPAPALEGDLVVCVPVVLDEARQQGKTGEAHFAHLVVHGMLHLLGYDHENDAQAAAMEDMERQILAQLGYADPYADSADSYRDEG
jgi:probable rRNA maturation factor